MKKCKYCKMDIPKDATKCQHCAGDLRNWFKKHWIISIVLCLIAFSGFISLFDGDSPSSDTPVQTIRAEEIVAVTATKLYNDYQRNELDADAKYKNKVLDVSGSIDSIAKDIADNPYVTLKTGDFIFTVQCMLVDSEETKAAQLQKGQQVTVRGFNGGKLGNIILKNCVIK